MSSYTGLITADAVNVRGGPGLNFEVICKLEKNDVVMVEGGQMDWLKIALPRHGSAYIFASYITPQNPLVGTVNTDTINIRAGKGLEFSVLGQLQKNDSVELLAREGDWYQIYTPQNCFAWVHKDFVKNQGPASLFLDQENRDHEAITLVLEAENFERSELARAQTERNFAPIVQKYQTISRDFPHSRAADYAQQRIVALEQTVPPPATTAKSATGKAAAEPLGGPIAEGRLMETGRVLYQVGTHKLIQHKKTVYFLKSETVNLNDFVYYPVQIWGTIDSAKGKIPVITVTHVQKLN